MSNPISFSKPLAAGVTLHFTSAESISFELETGAGADARKIRLELDQARLVMKFFELPDSLPGERKRIAFGPRSE
jgi:hypothetical protein